MELSPAEEFEETREKAHLQVTPPDGEGMEWGSAYHLLLVVG